MSQRCATCNRDPKRMNSTVTECSHVACPHRPNAWGQYPLWSLQRTMTTPREADPGAEHFDRSDQ